MTAIGRALMSRPRLFVLDEPSMGLAPLIVEEIFRALRRLNRDEGLSILVAEQNSAVALQYADRATVLENGVSVLEGTAAELRQRDDIKAYYLGGSPPSTRRPYPQGDSSMTIQSKQPSDMPQRRATGRASVSQGACHQDRRRGDRCRRKTGRRIRQGCLQAGP